MNEMELVEVLKGFKQALDYLHEENKALNNKVDELSAVLYDDLLSPVNEAIHFAQDEENFGNFKDKYSSNFDPYANEYAALYNGNDIMRDVYDTYNEHSDEYDEAIFVDEAIKSIAATIQETKEKLGIPAEQKVEVTETEDGSIEITPAETEDETETEVETVEAEEEVIDDPEEVAAFEAELEKFKK